MKTQCEDNGLIINFPNENFTKIDDNKLFKKFSGIFNNFKVMDCCWFDEQKNCLWLIELKQYYNPYNTQYINTNISDKTKRSSKIRELLQKTIGTLLLLNDRYETIKIFPENITINTQIKIFHILRVKPEHKDYLQFMTDKLKGEFSDFPLYADVLAVIDYNDAKKIFKSE